MNGGACPPTTTATIFEANRLGLSVIGTDINPMAYWIVRQALTPLNLDAFREAMVNVAVECISRGAPTGAADTVHRLAKVDTADGLASLRHVAAQHVPYAVLLYERYLGRPFASHRDSVSEMVGDVMESAIEERLARPESRSEKRDVRSGCLDSSRRRTFSSPPRLIPPRSLKPKTPGMMEQHATRCRAC